MLVLLSISILVAVAAVYFLRFLFWMRDEVQESWKRHTPPFQPSESTVEQEPSKEVIFRKAETRTIRWSLYGLGFYFGIIGCALILSLSVQHFEIGDTINSSLQGNIISEELMGHLTTIVTKLPILGELSGFYGLLPGTTTAEKFLINGTAVFFTVSSRNLAFLLENIDIVYERSQVWVPNRYTALLLCSFTGQFFSCVFGVLFLLN